MLYQKNFPQKRQPYYWAIVSSYLASVSTLAAPGDQKLYGQIACRLLARAAADAITACSEVAASQGHPNSNSSRALKDPRDLLFLISVYRSQAMYKDAIELLDNPYIGLCSDFCEKSWDLIRLKIELLQCSGSHVQAWEFCYDLLQDAHPENLITSSRKPRLGFGSFGDDCLVWDRLVRSASCTSNM